MYENEVRQSVNDSQKFIVNNLFSQRGDNKKWFININYKDHFIRLHPEGGKIDSQYKVTERYIDSKETELRDLKSGKTFWYGLFDSFQEAIGFSCIIAKVYISKTKRKLRVTACKDDLIQTPINPFEENINDL